MKRLTITALPILLAACVTDPSAPPAVTAQEPMPVTYRQAAREYLRTKLFDPYSVRDAMISEPAQRSSWVMGVPPAWTVCVRMNAKNRMGGYTGLKETVLLYRAGKVAKATDGPAPYYCGDAKYDPFPELLAAG